MFPAWIHCDDCFLKTVAFLIYLFYSSRKTKTGRKRKKKWRPFIQGQVTPDGSDVSKGETTTQGEIIQGKVIPTGLVAEPTETSQIRSMLLTAGPHVSSMTFPSHALTRRQEMKKKNIKEGGRGGGQQTDKRPTTYNPQARPTPSSIPTPVHPNIHHTLPRKYY